MSDQHDMPSRADLPGPLNGFRVFDATMYMAGPWASMVLGSLGAEVFHVEQPDVDWATLNGSSPPLIHGTASGYIAWNMNKRGISIDFGNRDDLDFAYRLIESCDVFVSNMRPLDRMGIGYERLAEVNPRLVYCRATGYGHTGPRGADRGTDATIQTFAGGWATQGSRGGNGEFYRHATQVDATTGNLLAQAAILGLHARRRTGRGQFIEVTMIDAAATLQSPRLAEHFAGFRHEPQGSSAFATAPDRAFLCEDRRWIGVSATSEDEWRRLCTAVGHEDLIDDERFARNADRVVHRAELESLLVPVFATQPRACWELVLSRAGVPWGADLLFEDLRDNVHVARNRQLVRVETDAWGDIWTGGPPWQFSATPARVQPAPIPGIDTDAVREELVARPAVPETSDPDVPRSSRSGPQAPLTGVRVLEAAEGVAGPMLARLLGDAGADVIKVEVGDGDRARGWSTDLDRTGAAFGTLNRNKRSVAVDADDADDLDDLDDLATLVGLADVLVVDEAMAGRLGLDLDAILGANPDLVLCVISGWGASGSWAGRAASELAAQLASEATTSLGRPGDEPVRIGTDHAGMSCALYGVQAVTAALLVDGDRGQRIDLSLFGSLVHMRSAMWVALSNPDEWWGFHLDSYTKPPEHFYTCKDSRVLFQVYRVPDMTALFRDLGMEFVFDDPRWPLIRQDTGALGRYSGKVHDLWDRGLSKWTFEEAREIFERNGGTLVQCLGYDGFVDDPQVHHLGLVVGVDDGAGGTTRDVRPPWQLADTPAVVRTGAPRLDEHGDRIRKEIVATRQWTGET